MNYFRTPIAGGALGVVVGALCRHFGFSSIDEWALVMGSAVLMGCFI